MISVCLAGCWLGWYPIAQTRSIGVAPGVAALHAQQPPRPTQPRFTAEAELITVDASVVDAQGMPVEGLRQDDFVVLEDGVPQQIAAFQAVTMPEQRAMPLARRDPGRISVNTEPESMARTFVIVFDDLHLTEQQARGGRSAVTQLLETGVLPGDRVTVASTARDLWWHARMPEQREELLEIVKSLDGQYKIDSSAERISEWEAYRIEMHQDMDVALRVKRRFDSYGAAGQSRLSGPIPREEIAKSSVEGIIDPIVRGRVSVVYNQALARNRQTLAVLSRALGGVSYVPGRKSIVLVSQGFVYEQELPDMRDTVRASLRANAPIYFINARGLTALSEATSAAQVGPVDAQDTLVTLTDAERESEGAEAIALDTGGFAVEHTNDLARGLLQLSRESGSYYLLGYRPPERRRDGRFRKIEVRLQGSRPGLTVKARRGYYAAADSKTAAKSGEDPDIVAALDAPIEVPDVPLRATAYTFDATPDGLVTVLVTTDVDVRQFAFAERRGRFEDAMAYVIEVRGRRNGQRYRYDEKVEMTLHPSTRARLSKTWYAVSREFKLPSGPYRARVVVRDLAGGRLGSVTHTFEVAPPSELRISTPVVSDTLEPGANSTSLRPLLIARRQFPMDATLYCQYQVYGAAPELITGLPRVTAGYELRRTSGDVFKRAAPTPLKSLAGPLLRLHGISLAGAVPGDYELILTVTDEVTQRTVTAREPLTIVAEL